MTGPALLVHWDGYLPGANRRYRLSFLDALPHQGTVAPGEDPWTALLGDGSQAARPLILGAAPGDPVRPAALRSVAAEAGFDGFRHGLDPALLAGPGPVRASARALTHHRRAVASNHWRAVRALLHLLDGGEFDLIAVRLPGLSQLIPLAQHPGHVRHALSMVNDVSARVAELVRPRETALVATSPVLPLPPTPLRLLRLDRRRRAPRPERGGVWHATRPLDLPPETRGASAFASLLRRPTPGGG